VEAWAYALITSVRLEDKCAPPPLPDLWEADPARRDVMSPGRPPELRSVDRGLRLAQDLRPPAARAKLLHTLWHHELQAAELMAWALLRFADAPQSFRQGLVRICQDEIRHMNAYQGRIIALGFSLGDFPVRDWFWARVPQCDTPVQFVALMGMGLEAANLEHANRFESRLTEAGDNESARVQAQIGSEEEGHVRFATHWYQRWTEGLDFDRWRGELPPPLSPLLMRGLPIATEARRRAGMSEAFIQALTDWTPEADGAREPGRGLRGGRSKKSV
jgi:uncharacterized ferritin-like protein (DUF455 family)